MVPVFTEQKGSVTESFTRQQPIVGEEKCEVNGDKIWHGENAGKLSLAELVNCNGKF
jgi:hypothetical protein